MKDVANLFQEADLQYTSRVAQLDGQVKELQEELQASNDVIEQLRQGKDAAQDREKKYAAVGMLMQYMKRRIEPFLTS